MKRSEFPEKAYESMFIHELLQFFAGPNKITFYIPSQVAEKRCGYDLFFSDSSGNPLKRKVLLIQFKVSEEYTKKKPHEHFKFEIYKTNEVWNRFKQHNKLCRYNTYGSRVAGVYAAPRFVTYKDLYIKVQRSEIIADSELFIPTVRLYSGHHFVKFDQADARQCSREEIKITMKSFEELLQGIESISKEQFEELLTNDVEMETNELPPFEEEDLPQKESTHKKDVEEMYPSGGGQYFLFI